MTSKQSWAYDIDRLSEAVNGLQKCLECTICLDLMKAPVKTRCGHSFCQMCMGRVLQRNTFCPLCKEPLNKRSISKDDHLELCIQKFINLTEVIQTESHIDVLSHSKQPRDTKESCSNSSSSQSSTSHKKKRTKKRSIRSNDRSNQSTSKTDRPSTSRRTVIDCDNPQYDENSLAQPGCHRTSLTNPLFTDGNDNTPTPDVKVRTWIHVSPDTIQGIENEICSSVENTSKVNKDTERTRSRDRSSRTRKTDSGSRKLKYKEIHAKVHMKDHNRFANAGKSDIEDRVCTSRDGSPSPTTSNQTCQVDAFGRSSTDSHVTNASTVGNRSSSTDATWNRVREVDKEMREKKKKKKMKKLNVSTEKSSGKSIEKCNENTEKNNEMRNEKNTKKTPNKKKSVPRIIEDIMLSASKKYEPLNKNFATNDDTNSLETNVSNQSRKSDKTWNQDAIDKKRDLSDMKIRTETNESMARNQEESFTDDKADSSMLEANSRLAETSLTENENMRFKITCQLSLSEFFKFKEDFKIDDANVPDRKQHLVTEKDEEQEEDLLEIMTTETFDSPSLQRQRLIVLTPEKLNESVEKRKASHDSGSRTPVSKLASPMSNKSRSPSVNNDIERLTTTPEKGALQPQTLNRFRLSLKRNLKALESPSFSEVPLMERLLIHEFYSSSSKSRKSVDSSVSNKGPSLDRLATVRRDLSSQINNGVHSPIDSQATTTVCEPSVIEDNNRNIGGTVCQDNRLSVESMRSWKSSHIDNRAREGGSVKFTQLGTFSNWRNVKYYRQAATKHEQRLPAEIRVSSDAHSTQHSKYEMYQRGNKSPSFECSFISSNDSQDLTGITVVENVHKTAASLNNTVVENVHKTAASLNNTVLETTRLTHDIPASSTPKTDANRRLDGAETTARGSFSTSVINKPSIVEEAPQLPGTPRANQSAAQQKTPQIHSHTTNSIRLLSPDKDSQLKFLTIDSPMSQHGQSNLVTSTLLIQSELEKDSTSVKDNNLAMKDLQTDNVIVLSSDSFGLEEDKKRKRDNDEDDADNDDFSVSTVRISNQCTIKLDSNSQDKPSSHSNVDKKRRLSSSRERGDEVICLDLDDRGKAHERKFKRIVSISDSDTESESSARTVKSNRNKSGDRCDQESTSITSTPKRRKSMKTALDEDLRIRNIVDKWSNEHSAAQKRPTEEIRSAQDTVKPMKLTSEEKTTHHRSVVSLNLSESEKRGSAKLSEKNTESDLFFESNSIFNSEGLEQLATRQSDKSSKNEKEQESPSSMDLLTDDIINKVLQINRSHQSNPSACQSTDTSRTNNDETSGRNKNECNLLQDNFDEIIANVELPQSEDVIPFYVKARYSELPAHRNPDRNLNRTLTEQNTSSCLAMTNESRDVTRQMKPASSTADIFEYCGYSGGKSAKKAHTTSTSGNSDKENTVSHSQRKHDHAEEDRRDKKNVAKSPDAIDKAGREKIASKNNVSQEKRGSFEHAEVTLRAPRMEKEINVPTGSTSRADESRMQGRASDDNESNAKDLSSDSLMNITLRQNRLKMIEEDLFGVAPARIDTKASKMSSDDLLREEQRTPKKRKRGTHEKNAPSQEHSADEDDIVENTPETKMRNSSKTIDSGTRRSIANLSPIPSFSERLSISTTSPRERSTSKSERTCTPLCRRNLMHPLYQSTPKVMSSSMTSSSMTGNYRNDMPIIDSKGQLDKQRATTSDAVSTPAKRTAADGSTTSGNACQQSDQKKLRFVCTSLPPTEVENVQRFARHHNADYVRHFDPSVTHVIVNTSGKENAAKNTLKYLQGIAYRKWVVSYKWIEDCIIERTLLPELPYEAATQSADSNRLGFGPRNSRLSNRGLFEDFTFCCYGPYIDVTIDQCQDLLRATGATVVNSLKDLAYDKKKLKGVVIQGDNHEEKIESWYRDARAPPIPIEWIVECISHYKLLPLISFMQMLSPQNYCAIGYPQEIVGEEDFSDTSA